MHGSTQAAIQYLHADTVQELINAIALHVEGSSLDVERKHRLDKTNEKTKCVEWQRQAETASFGSGEGTPSSPEELFRRLS